MAWFGAKNNLLIEYWKAKHCWRVENVSPLGQEPVPLGLRKIRKLKPKERILVSFLDINVKTIKANVTWGILLHPSLFPVRRRSLLLGPIMLLLFNPWLLAAYIIPLCFITFHSPWQQDRLLVWADCGDLREKSCNPQTYSIVSQG